MRKIDLQTIEFAQNHQPDFTQAVQNARDAARESGSPATITSTLEAFYDDPMTLYACLWYADTLRVSVTFQPSTRRTRSHSHKKPA